jgi:hypothetical protein
VLSEVSGVFFYYFSDFSVDFWIKRSYLDFYLPYKKYSILPQTGILGDSGPDPGFSK